MPANSIFSGPVSNNSIFNIVLTERKKNSDGKARTKKKKKAYGFQILHYYRSFSSNIVAVKGLKSSWRADVWAATDNTVAVAPANRFGTLFAVGVWLNQSGLQVAMLKGC